VLKKADGLSDEQLRRVLVGSGTTILGLVQHLTVAERFFGVEVPADRSAEQVLADYREARRRDRP
jgi:hypothetical protein